MIYQEFDPTKHLTRHAESYWSLSCMPHELDNKVDVLLPHCIFNLVFTSQVLYIRSDIKSKWIKVPPGGYLFGQRTSSLQFLSKKQVSLFVVRIKPFALSHILKNKAFEVRDRFVAIDGLFNLGHEGRQLVSQIIKSCDHTESKKNADSLLSIIFNEKKVLDEVLREQLNYILENRGMIKVVDMFQEFGTSKVTLRKHFVNKVGLTPKQVAQIWRMNYFVQLKTLFPKETMTSICLRSGFYDQAHFIKDFRKIAGIAPGTFFQREGQLFKISKDSIIRRFTNQYDPRV